MNIKEIYVGNIAVASALIIAFYIFNNNYILFSALIILILTLLSEKLAKWIATNFNRLFKAIGHINATIILSIFYFLILTPIALIKQFFSSKKQTKSYWIENTSKSINYTDPW